MIARVQVLVAPGQETQVSIKILHNHIGYERTGGKRAVVRVSAGADDGAWEGKTFQIVRHPSGEVVHSGELRGLGKVTGWGDETHYAADFDGLDEAGEFAIVVDPGRPFELFDARVTAPFTVADGLIRSATLSDNIDYFKTQRCTGAFDRRDANVDFYGGSGRKADVHGGWYDASGDTSKYLSHLSYANFMNPQQTALLPWAFAHALEALGDPSTDDVFAENYRRRLVDEAAHGGDFLVRMLDEAGYFYMTVFDKWSKELDEREICCYETQQGHKKESWQSGYRQGAGMAIAALARLAALGVQGEYGPDKYLAAARKGFEHLEAHNLEYLDDGKENIIDDYCALMAAVELYLATKDEAVLERARYRAGRLIDRQSADDRFDGWFRADDASRPYFHAAEAGMPVLALCRFLQVETDAAARSRVTASIERALRFELAIRDAVPNPFSYPRQYTCNAHGEIRDAFFVPHINETGYWWQGENARLASLAAAARVAAPLFAADPEFRAQLRRSAELQLDWILGANPYDMCMVHGQGRNNPEYEDGSPQSAGGICNGITSGFEDEEGIDFAPESCKGRGDQVWRWGEQWIPHAAWFVVATNSPLG